MLGFSISHCCVPFFWAHLDIDDHTSAQIVSGLDVTCILVNLPSTHEKPGWTLLEDAQSGGSAPTRRETCIFHPCCVNHRLLSSKLSKLAFCLPHDVNERNLEKSLSVHTIVLWALHGGNK